MKKVKQDWAGHIAAIKAQGISASEYARQHGLAESTLYRWKSKLQRMSTQRTNAQVLTASAQASKFIALRLSEPQHPTPDTPAPAPAPEPEPAPAPAPCTLVLSGGIRLEMPTLPAPQWLAQLSCCTQGAH